MPKKNMTPEERKAWGEKMKKAREQKKLNEQIINTPDPSTDPDYQTLLKQIQEAHQAIAELRRQQVPNSGVDMAGGRLTGTYERYRVDPNFYPDPTPRLRQEKRLSRFAFDDNYELKWEVQLSQYETIDHIRTKEPRFVLSLIVKVYDDETGELTNRRFVILRGVFHEDPDAAIAIARDNGIEVDENNERDFLNEMRYLRFRDWLLEAFYPTPPPPSSNKKEVVIGNKLVEVYEVTSDKPESMAKGFADMSKKL